MNHIIDKLQHEAQQCQPEFSESLHKRCTDAIDKVQPSWVNKTKLEQTVTSTRYIQYKLSVVTVIMFIIGFIVFNSFLKPIRQPESPSDYQIAKTESTTLLGSTKDESDAIPITPETWEQLEQVSLGSEQNFPQVDSQKIKGRSASVYASVTNLIHEKTTAKAITKSIICQDYSMGNLLVKAGDLVHLPDSTQSDKNDTDK